MSDISTHPFFEGLRPLPLVIKSFNGKVLAIEENIFEMCSTPWPWYKNFLLSSIYEGTLKLKDNTFLSNTNEVLSEVVVVVEGAESGGVRINWLDEVLGDNHREREHHEFMQGMNYLKGQAEELRRQLDSTQDKMKQLAKKMASQNMSFTLAEYRQIQS